MKIAKFIHSIAWWVYILLSIIIILASLLVRMDKTNRSLVEQLAQQNTSLLKNMKIISWNQWLLQGKKIKKGLHVTDFNNNLISLDELIARKEGKVLVLRFFKSSCEDCQIQEMKMIQKMLNPENVLVIGSFGTAKELKLYMKNQGINLPAYNLESTDILIEGVKEPLEIVYSFITDGSHKLTAIHQGKGDLPELSEMYYKLIAEKIDS